MAKTGFCDTKPLLDLHRKVFYMEVEGFHEGSIKLCCRAVERRAPLRTCVNGCWHQDHGQPTEVKTATVVSLKMEQNQDWEWVLLQTTENFLVVFDHNQCSGCSSSMASFPCHAADGCMEAAVPFPLYRLQGLLSLQAMVPNLLRNEVEMALEKLDHTFDRTCAWEMFVNMMRTQTKYSFLNTELTKDITDITYSILVEWLIQVHGMLQFETETLYLAVHLLNRCLRQIRVSTAKLQLLACVCFFIAAKMEESCLPEVSGLCFLMDHSYTKDKLLRMERKVLVALKFDLSYCPPVHFLEILVAVSHCSNKVKWMARYLLELSLLEAQCVQFLPMHLAGAALCLAHKVLEKPLTQEGQNVWYLAFSFHAESEATLLRIMHILATAAAKADNEETSTTFVKFSSPETMCVSKHPGLKNAVSCAQALAGSNSK